MASTKIATRLNAKELTEKRDEIILLATKAMETIQEMEILMATMFSTGFDYNRGLYFRGTNAYDNIQNLTKQLDRKVWHKIMQLGEFESVMTSQKKEKLWKDIDDNCPPATYENISATFKDMLNGRFGMLQELVETVYLCRATKYKNNQGNKINKKYIITSAYGTWSYGRGRDRLNDMLKAIYILDGKKPDCFPYYELEKVDELYILDGRIHLKRFLNGNVHFIIKDKTILDKLNGVLAGANPFNIGQ